MQCSPPGSDAWDYGDFLLTVEAGVFCSACTLYSTVLIGISAAQSFSWDLASSEINGARDSNYRAQDRLWWNDERQF